MEEDSRILVQITENEIWRALQESDINFGPGELDSVIEVAREMREKFEQLWVEAYVNSVRESLGEYRDRERIQEEGHALLEKLHRAQFTLLDRMLDDILKEENGRKRRQGWWKLKWRKRKEDRAGEKGL